MPAPNPKRFKIVRAAALGEHLVVDVHYPDCTNFEGRKVMVFRNTRLEAVMGTLRLDPHFRETGGPTARFRPDAEGWSLAVIFASRLR
jgi:hypothetical protein